MDDNNDKTILNSDVSSITGFEEGKGYLLESLTVLSKNPQMVNVFETLDIDVDEILENGDLEIEELLDMTSSFGHRFIESGAVEAPSEERKAATKALLEESGIEVDAHMLEGISTEVTSSDIMNLMQDAITSYCNESGDKQGLCKTFDLKAQELEGVEAIPNSSADPEQYNKENDNVLQPIKGVSPS